MMLLCLVFLGCTGGGEARPADETAERVTPCGSASHSSDDASVAVYFACDTAPPGSLSPALRPAPPDSADRLRVALENLLAGPTAAERQQGYRSFFSEQSADALRNVRTSAHGDTVWIDFRNFTADLPQTTEVKSFLPPGAMAELTWTIFRSSPEIWAVHFAFDGGEAAFWQWLGSGVHVFTREDWERV